MNLVHGTKTGYGSYGCRCDLCKEAQRQYMLTYRQTLAERPREEVPHGKRSGYVNWGCRCEDCKQANAFGNRDAARRWALKRRAEKKAEKS